MILFAAPPLLDVASGLPSVALSPLPLVALPSVALSPLPLVAVPSVALSPVEPLSFVANPFEGYFDAFISPVPSPDRQYSPNHVFPPMPSPAPVSHNGVHLYLSGAGNKRSAVQQHELEFSTDAGSDSDDGVSAMQAPKKKMRVIPKGKHQSQAVKLPPPKGKSVNAKKTKGASKSSSAASSVEPSDSSTGDDAGEKSSKFKKSKMPRITNGEREYVCDWIQKMRKDGKVMHVTMRPATLPHVSLDAERALDTQWGGQRPVHDSNVIRGQNLRSLRGACTVMYISFVFVLFVLWLRRYVNRRLRATEQPMVWTKDVARKRWTALCVTCFTCLCLCCLQ
jgi:hypothetical protein